MFGTAMNYTALRLLGADAEDPRMVKARKLLWELGGALKGPHWAKWWLSVLGVLEWEVVNPVPPEIWYVVCIFCQICQDLIAAGCFLIGFPLPPGGGGSICVWSSCPCRTSIRRSGRIRSTI